MKSIVVFDLETTGLDRAKDQIIQFAGLKIDRDTNNIIDTMNLYIKPTGDYQISIQAYFKHGIKPEFLKDKPHFYEVGQDIANFLKDSDILTYNGTSFDIPFLLNEFERCGIEFSFLNRDCYDAFLEEKRRKGNSLSDTYARYKGMTMEEAGLSAHDALSDVKATYTIFYAQQKNKPYGPEKMYGEDNSVSLQEFQGKLQPCMNIGKYKGLSIDFIKSFDMQYLNWTISDKCNFTKSTKEFIKECLK